MRMLILACLTALAVPQSTAQDQLSQKDRDAGVKYLEETRAKFLASIDGLSDAQWTFKAGPDRWSIAEVAEHIAVSEAIDSAARQGSDLKVAEGAGGSGAGERRESDRGDHGPLCEGPGAGDAEADEPLAHPRGAHQGFRGGAQA